MSTLVINSITVELVSTPSPSLLCPICKDVFSEPLINQRCHHSFCTVCIQKNIEVSPTCPLCRCQLKVSDLHPNLALAGLINEIPVFCINRENGCTSTVPLDLFQSHVEKCHFTQRECPHAIFGCEVKCFGPDLISHLNACPFQAILPFINETTSRLQKLEELILRQAEELDSLKGIPAKQETCPGIELTLASSPQHVESSVEFPYNEVTNQETLSSHTSGVTSLCYSNGLLFSGAHDGIVQIHDTADMSMLWKCPTHVTSVWGLAVAQDEKRFFSASSDGMIKAWDWASETNSISDGMFRALDHHSGKVYSLLCRFGKLFSGSSDRTIKIWDHRNLELSQTLSGHQGSVNCITALRNNRLLSGSSDLSIKLWDLNTSQCLNTLPASDAEVLDVVASEDQKLLFASTYDASILVFNLETNSLITTLQGHNWEVWKLALLQNRLFSASFDHTIKRWDTRMFLCDNTLTGHKGFVHALALSPDGIFSGCADRTIKFWK